MKRIYLILTGLILSLASYAIGPITGTSVLCSGSSVTLSDSAYGGTWASSNTAVATIGATSGILSGIAAGTVTITYSLGASYVITTVTVNAAPAPISGTGGICQSASVTLTDATPGGAWYSSDTGTAGIDSSGTVTGITAGTATISYVTGSGCLATSIVTIFPAPTIITGGSNLCGGSTVVLSDGIAGGIWSSSNTSVATIGVSTGVIYGISAGNTVITYTTSCGIVTSPVTVNPIPPAVTGPATVCASGGVITLANTVPGGIWATASTSIATVGSLSGSVTGVSAGVSVITYLLGTGCMATRAVTVNPNLNAIAGSENICIGATTTLFDAVSGGTWSGSNAAIATVGPLSGIVTGVAQGSAVITYNVSGYCATHSSVYVYANPSVITGAVGVCAGATIILYDTTAGGAWSSSSPGIATAGSASGVVRGVSAGAATITYTLYSGCLATANITVNATPAAITGPANLCTGAVATLTDAAPGGIWGSAAPAVAAISSAGVVSGMLTGTAAISYTLATGCYAVKTETVYPSPSVIAGPSSACEGSVITLTDAVTGGTWSGSGLSVIIGSATGIVSAVTAGTATITYAIAGTCMATKAVTVNPVASISGLPVICTGVPNTYTASISGGGWSSAGSAITIGSLTGSVTGIAAGTAAVTYTLATGCMATKPVTVYNPPAAITGATAICAGHTAYLSDPTYGGLWSSSDVAIATAIAGTGVVTGISAGTVSIFYSLPSGCMAAVTLSVNPLPAPISGSVNGCAGATTILNDTTTGGYWSAAPAGIATIGAATGTVTGVSAGTAVITYTLPLTGCAITKTITINPATPAITGLPKVCEGSSITLADPAPAGAWASGNTAIATTGPATGVVTGVAAGTVAITYTLPTGCTAARTLTVNPVPLAITGTSHICLYSTTILNDATPGGIWASSSFGTTIGSATGLVSGIGVGSAIISYTIANGCAALFPFAVNPLPVSFTVLGGGNYCAGGPGERITLDGSSTGNMYQLYMGGVISGAPISGSGVPIDFGLITTPGTYTVIAEDFATGCTANMSSGAIITVNPLPSAYTVTGGGGYCAGGAGAAIHLTSSDIGVSYQLFNGGTAVSGSLLAGTGAPLYFGLHTAGYYTVTGANVHTGCSSNMAFGTTVTVIPDVVAYTTLSALPGDTVCAGTPVAFTAMPFNGGPVPHYQWRVNGVPIGTDSAGVTYTPSNFDVISVNLSSSATCATPTDTLTSRILTVNPYPGPITGNTHICQGATATLNDTTTGGTWASSDPSIALIATIGVSTGGITGIAAGNAVISYIPVTGCITTATLTVKPLPAITATAASAGCGGNYILTAGGALAYSWAPPTGLSCGTCAVTGLQPTGGATYFVTGTDTAGCADTASITINGNRISGYISFSGAVPDSNNTMVWLVQYNPADSSVISIDSTITCTDGGSPYYEFDGKPDGHYIVRSKLLYGNNEGGSGYLPTYGPSTPYWDSAAAIAHSGSFDTLHIGMLYGTVPAGQGTISGTVYTTSGIAAGIIVFLVDPSTNNTLTYTYTDSTGAYSFHSLGYTGYIVYPEEYAYYTTPSASVTLSGGTPAVTNVNFIQHIINKTITPLLTNGVNTLASAGGLTLYPNPTSGIVDIRWAGQYPGAAHIVVTDVLGQEAYTSVMDMGMYPGHARINLGDLKEGMYFITIKSQSLQYSTKIQVLK